MPLSFVALDFETANQKRGSVIQIGITRVLDGTVTKTATLFVTPPPGLARFDYHSQKVHGIRPQQVVGAPTWPEILDRLVKFAGALPLVAHAASVERSVIVQASEAHGIMAPEFVYYCTLKLSKLAFPNEPSHSLGKLSESIGLPAFAHHDAGEDATACATLVLDIARRYGVNSLEEMPGGWLAQPTGRRQPMPRMLAA